MTRKLLAGLLFAACLAAMNAADLRAADEPWPTIVFLATSLVIGFAVGRWWAIGLALLNVAAAVLLPDREIGIHGTVILALLITVPASAGSLGIGVTLRRLLKVAQGHQPAQAPKLRSMSLR